MTHQPFDLAKLDTEGIRHRKRRKLLVWSLPICIIVGTLGLAVLTTTVGTKMAMSDYAKKKYQSSQKVLGNLRYITFFDRYKLNYNYGTALLGNAQYTEAEQAFEEALLDVPHYFECQVRFNMVLAITAQAERHASRKDYDEAILAYDRAKAVIDGKKCGFGEATVSDETRDAHNKLDKKREEITEKQNRVKQEMNGDTPGDGDTNQDKQTEQSNTMPSKDKLEQLQQQQDAAVKELSKQKQTYRDMQYYDKLTERPEYDRKNW